MTKHLAMLAIVFLLAGCATSTPALPSSTIILATVQPSDTPTPRPTATATFTCTPTATPTATSTPTLTRIPTATFTPTRTPTITNTPLPRGTITKIDIKVRSTLLNEEHRLIIYLPPGYNAAPQRRYPVLYLLHGYGGCGSPISEWEEWGLKDRAESMIQTGGIQPMIIVQPQSFMGDCQPSYYFNHEPGTTDGKPWADYIWGEVVSYIDQHYRTLARAESRAIGGFSLGGQGALSLAFLHPDVFKIVGAHSPSFRGADGSIPFINSWNWYNQYDPIWLAQHTDKPRQLSIWIDVGTEDDKVRNCGPDSDRCVLAFHELLNQRNIAHEWHGDWIGKHHGPTYWGPHIPDYLTWYSSHLLGQ